MARRNEALFGGRATVRYILEGVRAGRLLEDLDALAGTVAFDHCQAPGEPDLQLLRHRRGHEGAEHRVVKQPLQGVPRLHSALDGRVQGERGL